MGYGAGWWGNSEPDLRAVNYCNKYSATDPSRVEKTATWVITLIIAVSCALYIRNITSAAGALQYPRGVTTAAAAAAFMNNIFL